jgi:hypothetical protein
MLDVKAQRLEYGWRTYRNLRGVDRDIKLEDAPCDPSRQPASEKGPGLNKI